MSCRHCVRTRASYFWAGPIGKIRPNGITGRQAHREREASRVVSLRQNYGIEAARQVVATGVGMRLTPDLRTPGAEMLTQQTALLEARSAVSANKSARKSTRCRQTLSAQICRRLKKPVIASKVPPE